MKKPFFVLLLSLAMVLSLSACGGGSSSEAPAEAAEPNAGISGIVFTVPDGWTVSDVGQNYITYKNPDSAYELNVNTMSQENIAEMEDEDASLSVQEYFEKYSIPNDEDAKKYNFEYKTLKICDSDGYLTKYTGDAKGINSMNADWLFEDMVYSIGYYCPDNYDYDNDGKLKDDAVLVSSDEEKAFEEIVASVRPGDGAALMRQSLKADSVGSIAFEAPEGYTLTAASDNYVALEKGDVTLRLNLTTEEEFNKWDWDGEEKPSSLEEYFQQNHEGMDTTTVAGCDGYEFRYPEENGNYYDASVSFMNEDGIYDISIGTDAYDENGLKADAIPLTEDDLAAFDSFVASLQKK